MKTNTPRGISLLAPAILFTVGLTYTSIELPVSINKLLHNSFSFPGSDPGYSPELLNEFLTSNHLNLIGYGALALLVILILLGIVWEKRGLAAAGGFAFFLPVFGHFCRSMFFLAGLGLLRVLWLPVTDISFDLLRLGEIVYLPYAVLVYLPALFKIDIRNIVPYVIMSAGILIFVLGVLSWFTARMKKKMTADFMIYRFSRHPQYLGWILWSYGLMIYFIRYSEGTHFKISWMYPDSLAFLISSVIIIGVALIEEVKMRRERGEEYGLYMKTAPFLLPLPKFVSDIISAPIRLIIKKDRPESGKEIALTLTLYTGLLMLLSVPFILFDFPPRTGWWAFPYNVFPFR